MNNSDDFNPLNQFLNFDKMANDMMNQMKRENNNEKILGHGKQEEEGIVKFEDGNKKKNVQVTEIEDENGFQRNVVRDLGNGKKSVEITRFMRHDQLGKDGNKEMPLSPFKEGIQRMPLPPGFNPMGMGMPMIIIRKKNLNRRSGTGSPVANPINFFAGLDSLFENMFDEMAENLINVNKDQNNNKHAFKEEFDIDDIDLSLNETDSGKANKIKINSVKDVKEEKKKETKEELGKDDLTIEDIPKESKKNKKERKDKSVNKTRVKHIDPFDVLKEKAHKKIQPKKVKNPLFVLICKLLFYFLCMISFYILGKKLLEKSGLIYLPEDQKENNSSTKATEEIPLKTTEITEVKNQVNKND